MVKPPPLCSVVVFDSVESVLAEPLRSFIRAFYLPGGRFLPLGVLHQSAKGLAWVLDCISNVLLSLRGGVARGKNWGSAPSGGVGHKGDFF